MVGIYCTCYSDLCVSYCRKKLFKAVHNFVHLNLAIALFVGYLTFAVGVELAKSNKVCETNWVTKISYDRYINGKGQKRWEKIHDRYINSKWHNENQFPFTKLNGIFQNFFKSINSILKKSSSCKAESMKCVEMGMEFIQNCVDFWTEFRNKLDYLPESV